MGHRVNESERPAGVTLHSPETESAPDEPEAASTIERVIPFYGATDPELFAIERTSMDRAGKVIRFLDETLPESGLALDVGAGDGFTAEALTTLSRTVVALEPAAGMIRAERPLYWCRGKAQALPFADASFQARTRRGLTSFTAITTYLRVCPRFAASRKRGGQSS